MELLAKNTMRRAIWAKVMGASDPIEIDALINRHFGYDAVKTKAAVGAITAQDLNLSDSTSADYVREIVVDRVLGPILQMGFNVDFSKYFNDAMATSASWVGEFRPIPVSKSSLEKDRLPSLKVAALTALSVETLQHQFAWKQLGESHEKAVGDALDAQLINPALTGLPGESPRSLTAYPGVESIPANSNPATAMKDLLQNFRNLNTSILISDPETLSRANLTSTVFQDCGARGGFIAGIPVVSTTGSPQDSNGGQIVLLDASAVAVALGGLDVVATREASLEMDNAFDSDGDGTFINLFQVDGIAMKTLIYANWKLLDAGACRILTGCDW